MTNQNPPTPSAPPCPNCNAPLQTHHGKEGTSFWYCPCQSLFSSTPVLDTGEGEMETFLEELERTKPQPYCIGTVDSFEDIEEIRKNPLDDEVLIFPEECRHFCVELFKGWDKGHEGILPKMISYLRTIQARNAVLSHAAEEVLILRKDLKRTKEEIRRAVMEFGLKSDNLHVYERLKKLLYSLNDQ